MSAHAQPSVARAWGEVLLEAIRDDFARPTVHARNLFHTSIALYDAWAAYDEGADTYLLGKTVNGYACPFDGVAAPTDVRAAREEAMSYAAYRLLRHRFARSPGVRASSARFDSLLVARGYTPTLTTTDYAAGDPAALGNHLAQCLIGYGLQDGANEQQDYAYTYYEPVNPPLFPAKRGNPDVADPNRWQPLALDLLIDQGGNVLGDGVARFLGPEWGRVLPFALTDADRAVYEREGRAYPVYHDPGPPPHTGSAEVTSHEAYMWGFALVALWSSHLDPSDGVLWDISPASQGNAPAPPRSAAAYETFYDLIEGGDPGRGHPVNPHTGRPYAPQRVPRGDYTRVLAEFWADGPDSETPPGHWFSILHYVSDHPLFERRLRGQGPVLDDLEWDVKAYFALGGAMHDAAVAAWGIKGWYDYARPISAIRSMADRGQCTDPELANYDPGGLPLIPGFIEVVQAGDPLAGRQGEHVGEVKVYAWRGPTRILDPRRDVAGVGWILARDWWPYQRPTFVTPPFAGYVSGHSTFSRAAAEVMTLLTGDPYFPGGLGEFHAPKDSFLVFERGPSVDVTLQWATYRDASDQTSLSRIWGGIHPPADDVPGRLIGERVGTAAFRLAEDYFVGRVADSDPPALPVDLQAFPNPVAGDAVLTLEWRQPAPRSTVSVYNLLGQRVDERVVHDQAHVLLRTQAWPAGVYFVRVTRGAEVLTKQVVVVR